MRTPSLHKFIATILIVVTGAWGASAQSNLVVNPSFEANAFTNFPGYCFQAGNGSISGWSFLGNVGLNPAGGSNPFANNGVTPDGNRVAFLQNSNAALSQTVGGLVVGRFYELRFNFNARSGFPISQIRVSLDGATVYTNVVNPVGGTANYHSNSVAFVADATNKVLRFEQTAGGDATLLIDNIIVRNASMTTTDDILKVSATTNEIILRVKTPVGQKIQFAVLAPFETKTSAVTSSALIEQVVPADSQIHLPRFVSTDRIYSGFIAVRTNTPGNTNFSGEIKYAEDLIGVSKYNEPFPTAPSKKGLQVQMNADAIAIGTKHAAINLNLSQLVDLNHTAGNPTWVMDGETFYFNQSYLNAVALKPLSDADMVLSLILIYIPNINPALDAFMLHPQFNAAGTLSAFNTSTTNGLKYFKASMEFLADRFSRTNRLYGRAVNFIVGNEVDSHWVWYNMGLASMETVAEDYLRTVRICQTAVRKAASQSRVYVSLDHGWNLNVMGDALKGFPSRTFLDYFAARAKAGGDFEWHIAHHPYPQNLFEPRTWLDTTATANVLTSPRITFKNIELLPQYLSRSELLYRGTQRRIILSEQGFHSDGTETGERRQAAGYCYAFHKIANLPGIDSFILHRHVDHSLEGGLNLGLWRRVTNSINTPGTTKPIYDVFKQADTTNWPSAFQFALAEIGITNWNQLITWSPPAFIAQPTNRTGIVDGTISFNLIASGSPSPTFQWRFNGVDLTNSLGTSGATNLTLTLSNLSFAQAGNYTVFLRNGHGTLTSSNASLTVLTMFEGWRRANFSEAELTNSAFSGAGADPDADGLVNAVEFTLNNNPRTADTRALLQPRLTNDLGQLYLVLNYRERLGTSGLIFINEFSTNLLQWSGQGVTTGIVSQDSVTRTIEVRASVSGHTTLSLRSSIYLQE